MIYQAFGNGTSCRGTGGRIEANRVLLIPLPEASVATEAGRAALVGKRGRYAILCDSPDMESLLSYFVCLEAEISLVGRPGTRSVTP